MVTHIVVGAGIAGLMAAREAAIRNEQVIVVEATPQPGGLVHSVTLAGITVDAGAEAFSITDDAVLALCAELNLDDVEFAAESGSCIVSGPDRYDIPKGVFGIPTSIGELRAVAVLSDAEIEHARQLDSAPLTHISETISVANLVRARLGEPILEKFVRPIVAGVHGGAVEDIEVRALVPRLLPELRRTGSLCSAAHNVRGLSAAPGAAVATIRGGLTRLIDALVGDLSRRGVKVLTSIAVDAVTKSNGYWRVEADGVTLGYADRVTLAVPAYRAAVIVAGFPALARALDTINYSDATVGIAVVHAPQLDTFPLKSGALVVGDPLVKATTHVTAKWPWRSGELPHPVHILRFSFDGAASRSEAAQQLIERGVHCMYGLDSHAILDSHIVRWPRSLVTPVASHSARINQIRDIAEKAGIFLVGSYMNGNGVTGIVRSALNERTSV